MQYPTLKEEKKLWQKGFKRVAGVDEAGVGPLAGNVTAAAVTLPASKVRSKKHALYRNEVSGSGFEVKKFFKGIKDSKKLSAKQREYFYNLIMSNKNIKYSVSSVSSKVIDKIGIRKATDFAIERCIQKLKPKPDFIILDGNRLPKKLKARSYKLVIKADEKIISCALASIIAKVTRDRIMVRMAKKYSEYGFARHKGYGTKKHFKMLKKYGPCDIHRKTFKPVTD